jgi:purine-binding chemotaxis protein CheW
VSATAPESWDELARAAQGGGDPEEAALLVRELLAFTVDGDPYAVPVERVREIVRMRPITNVPRVPAEILGVIGLRGEIVQVLDVRRRFGLEPQDPTRRHRIIVLHGDEGEVSGLLVDAVTAVLRVEEGAIRPPAAGESEFVQALTTQGDAFVGLLNLERVLDVG